MRKKSKYNAEESHHTTREEREDKINREKLQKQKTTKMAISTYLRIITLNVNGLNSLIKRHRAAHGLKKKRLCTRDSLQK